MSYKVPSQLLSFNNAKTIKSLKYGVKTYIMYLSPFTDNSQGINLCSHASEGCAKACLFNSGNARFNRIQEGRRNKTEYFLKDRTKFLNQLDKEVGATLRKVKKTGMGLAIRLNGTSDIRFEKFKIRDNKNIFELYPEIQFYDYTKNYLRFNQVLPENYSLTFSRSETNGDKVLEVLSKGANVAVVFHDFLPETYLGYPVINGDESDMRANDPKNVIVGLKYKRASIKGGGEINDEAIRSGFVLSKEQVEVDNAKIEKSLLQVA